jgi:acetyl esterase/lipase
LVDEIVPTRYREQWKSREGNAAEAPYLKDSIPQMFQAMEADFKSPWFSPFNASEPHKNLPPVYIQVGQRDILRDDGLVYEMALKEAGVSTRVDNYPTLGHEAWSIFSDEWSPRDLKGRTLDAMAWLLKRDRGPSKND